VIVELDGQMAMAVLPATARSSCKTYARSPARIGSIRFRGTIQAALPGLRNRAMPPFGALYGMDLYVAESLSQNEEIAFNAGSHTEIIKLAYEDFARLAKPKVVSFTT